MLKRVALGVSGIDIAAHGDDLWVPTRSAQVDPTGFPTMDALKHVSDVTGAVSVASTPSSRFDVHGLVAVAGGAWLADNTNGFLYSVTS